MTEAKPRCEGRTGSKYWSQQCPNNASMTHEGRHYCKLHHPPTVQAKNEARNAEMRAKIDREIEARRLANEASKERDRRAALFPELLEALIALEASYERITPPGCPPSDFQKKARAAISKATGETK